MSTEERADVPGCRWTVRVLPLVCPLCLQAKPLTVTERLRLAVDASKDDRQGELIAKAELIDWRCSPGGLSLGGGHNPLVPGDAATVATPAVFPGVMQVLSPLSPWSKANARQPKAGMGRHEGDIERRGRFPEIETWKKSRWRTLILHHRSRGGWPGLRRVDSDPLATRAS